MLQKIVHHPQLPAWLLRIGLAVIFSYAAIAAFIEPREWIGFLPPFLTALVPAELLLQLFSVVELLLVAWLLSGVYVRFAALFAALMLTGIVMSNITLFAISFRDIALIFAALALAAMPPSDQHVPLTKPIERANVEDGEDPS